MVACLFHFLAFLVSLLFSFFALTRKGEISDRYSINKSSKTNITNVGRLVFISKKKQKAFFFQLFQNNSLITLHWFIIIIVHLTSHLFTTAVNCRSMDFMPHNMYQQNLTNSNVRPPYYSKQQQQYEKTVAESMPELGITHSSSDIVTERVRRKSETCV